MVNLGERPGKPVPLSLEKCFKIFDLLWKMDYYFSNGRRLIESAVECGKNTDFRRSTDILPFAC